MFVTAFYSFRMYFLVFHGKERYDEVPHDAHGHDDHGHHGGKPHESPWVVTLPLVLLAIPSVLIGYFTLQPMVHGDWFGASVLIDAVKHPGVQHLTEGFHGAMAMTLHGLTSLPFALAMGGVATAWFFYLKRPDIPATLAKTFSPLYVVLDNKYYFDRFNEVVFAAGARLLGTGLWKGGDQAIIDGVMVNGSARVVRWFASVVRLLQGGRIYQYAFGMVFGVALLMLWIGVTTGLME